MFYYKIINSSQCIDAKRDCEVLFRTIFHLRRTGYRPAGHVESPEAMQQITYQELCVVHCMA